MRHRAVFSGLLAQWKLKRQAKLNAAKEVRLARIGLENLEDRTVLSTIPAPVANTHQAITDMLGGTMIRQARNPVDPNKLVITSRVGNQILGQVSLDGGQTWNPVLTPLIDNLTDPTSAVNAPFTSYSGNSIAFDLNNNFYVVTTERNATETSGALVMSKFTFAGNSPVPVLANQVLQRWFNNEPIYNPVIAIDTHVGSFTDPDTGAIQTDTMSNKGVYIAYNTNTLGSATPNGIRVMASTDGGVTFSNPVWASDAPTAAGDGDPQIQFAAPRSGSTDPTQMLVVWTNTAGEITVSRSSPDNGDPTNPGSVAVEVRTPPIPTPPPAVLPRPINDATLVGGVTTPTTSTFPLTVNVTNTNFTTVTDFDVFLNLTHPDLRQLRIELIVPGIATPILLLNNGIDANGVATGNGVASSANMGIVNGNELNTIFDQQATIPITQAGAAPYVGRFLPEGTLFNALNVGLNQLVGRTRTQINGTYTLRITDFRNNGGGVVGNVLSWGVRLNSRIDNTGLGTDVILTEPGTPTPVPIHTVPGSPTNAYPLTIPVAPNGVPPGVTLAQDTTLGSFSQYQGRLYLVGTRLAQNSAADDTDIFLITSDDLGATWSVPSRVNDDSRTDSINSGGDRPQLNPTLSVDPVTGTLLVGFYDTRYDAARNRAATFVTASIDGGATFSEQVFLNTPKQAIDALSFDKVTIEPIPTHSAGGALGIYKPISVSAYGGKLSMVWRGDNNSTPDVGAQVNTAVYAAGPRIIQGDMGPVVDNFTSGTTTYNNTFASDGTRQIDSFVVTFDRPVDPSSFTALDVAVRFTSPTGTVSNVIVAQVIPLDGDTLFGPAQVGGLVAGVPQLATRFRVVFAVPQRAVGTYSYAVGPNISDRIRNQGRNLVPEVVSDPPFDAPFTSTAPTNIVDNSTVTSTINVAGGGTRVVAGLTVQVNITHPATNELTLTLISPTGLRIRLATNLGTIPSANFTNTIFDDAALASITTGTAPFTGTFQPEQPLSGLIGSVIDGAWRLEVVDNATGNTGTITSWSLTITPGSYSGSSSNGNLMDQNANSITGETNVDQFAIPKPITGIAFAPAYDNETLPLIIPGPHVVGLSLPGGTPSSQVLGLNQGVSAIDVHFDRNMNASTFTSVDVLRLVGPLGEIAGPFTVTAVSPRIFRITFPSTQVLNGNYSVVLGANILSAAGDGMDANTNAGLDVLRGVGAVGGPKQTVSVDAPASGLSIGPGQSKTATLQVNTSFVVDSLTIRLNINTPNTPDIKVILQAPDGRQVQLFDGVGGASLPAINFFNTTLNDAATIPIQLGTANFSGQFRPQFPLNLFAGTGTLGQWKLIITNKSTTNTATLGAWTLNFTRTVSGTGLGEITADRSALNFRIFNFDPTGAVSYDQWTPVGPTAENDTPHSEQVTSIAVDPSDPTGNTVYVAGQTTGLWKTTNFLTTDTAGPSWIPLTDFGPNILMGIGSIVLIPQLNDPNRTIVLAGTGDPNSTTTGIGFLRSENGGSTWQIIDSSVNFDGAGNILPLASASRDHLFSGHQAFKIVADPTPIAGNQYIVYAAITGANGGIYRSTDSGKSWTRILTGNASDIALGLGNKDITGRVQTLYAALSGDGVYVSKNQGVTWTEFTGGLGRPLIRNGDATPPTQIPVTNPASNPSTAASRITLATPALSGDPTYKDLFLADWCYALVSDAAGNLQGLYVTKDGGQNWTLIRLPSITDPLTGEIYATNDETQAIFNFLNGTGNQALTLSVDPTNPRIIYVGGESLLRIDTTTLADPQAMVPFNNSNADGGLQQINTQGAATVVDPLLPFGVYNRQPGAANAPTTSQAYFNLTRDPNNPLDTSLSTTYLSNIAGFRNTGTDIVWNYMDPAYGANLFYGVVPFIDPVSHDTRLLVATADGVFSAISSENGELLDSIGSLAFANGSRNGNLQIMRLTSAATQPSNLAGEISKALFYATTQDRGILESDNDILQTGNLNWSDSPGAPGGGSSVATDPTGSGSVWKYRFPDTIATTGGPGTATDFIQLTDPVTGLPVSRTSGLVQAGDDPANGTGQWPANTTGSRIVINPFNPNTLVISSQAGRVFRTQNNGFSWVPIAEPGVLDGTYAGALAFGASTSLSPDNFIYAGTQGGQVFVTTDGGTWASLDAAGLDGSAVVSISANPQSGSRELYVTTQQGVYWMADSGAVGATWTNVTGALFSVTRNLFNDANFTQPAIPTGGILTSMVVDWRFKRPSNRFLLVQPDVPVIYVAGDGGVFRSNDRGKTWSLFPTMTQGAAAPGGLLPNIRVTDLALARGNFVSSNATTAPNSAVSFLLATTEGRGAFAIRLDPEEMIGGPRVVSVLPTDPNAPSISSVDVVFDGAVDSTTVNLNDFVLKNYAGGVIPITSIVDITPVVAGQGSLHNQYRLFFNPQVSNGVYTLTVGPTISDFAGNRMNQTPDGVNGAGAYDQYTARFFRNSTATGPTVPATVAALPSGHVLANYSNGVNSYNRVFWDMLPKTVTWVNVFTENVNGDQYTDYIGQIKETGEWWVSLGQAGGFTTQRWATWPPSLNLVNVLCEDFNGDGKWDIAGQNGTTGLWYVGLSRGSGFETQGWAVWDTKISWTNVRGGDFNGDGLDDIAGYDAATGRWYVAVSDGYRFNTQLWGSWQKLTYTDILVGDFNSDGLADIAGRQVGVNRWYVLSSNGTGFDVVRAWATWGNTTWVNVIAADFTGDGRTDIAGRDAVSGAWFVAVSNGTNFATTQWATWPRANWADVLTLDLNKDGRYDIVGRNATSGALHVLISNGTSFTWRVWGSWNPNVAWQDVRAGDFDGDGRMDVVGRNPSNGVTLLSRSVGTTFSTANWAVQMPTRITWVDFLTGDFNGDGKSDMAARIAQNGQWYVSLANGNGAYRLAPWVTWVTGTWVDVGVGDFDGDGKDDIAGRYTSGAVVVSLSNAAGTGATSSIWALWARTAWNDVRYGDFNGDGKTDIVGRRNDNGQVWASISTGSTFMHSFWSAWALTSWQHVSVGDFNGDGKDDVAALLGTGQWYVAQSTGTAFLPVATWSVWTPGVYTDVRVGDINGDGIDDISGRNVNTGVWTTGFGNVGNFFASRNTAVWPRTAWTEVFVVDMNGDGLDDLIGRQFNTGNWYVSLFNGLSFVNNIWTSGYLANFIFESTQLAEKG